MHLSKLVVRGFRASANADLEVVLPGRFALLIGANSAGKTTFCDAAYMGHGEVFPTLGRFNAAALGSGERSVEVEYRFSGGGQVEGPLGVHLQTQSGLAGPGDVAASWRRLLSRNMGNIRAQWDGGGRELAEAFKFVYLPATRNPIDELARREARILVELLRAQSQRLSGSRSLGDIRLRAWILLESLSREPIIEAVEERITTNLSALTAGVARQWPYVRGQRVDDAYLARVLELMLAVLEGRPNARPLDVSGLGYVNLLHIAVTLAAIPDTAMNASRELAPPQPTTHDKHKPESILRDPPSDSASAEEPDINETDMARSILAQAREEAESQEDEFFSESPFHATVVIEEPEAHLHPQLQHSLARHLRRTVGQRPELQIVLSSHATDIISSCRPEDLVVLRQLDSGVRVSRAVAMLPLSDPDKVFRSARLHLNASRSAALFAERLVLVEGVTDAALVREFGWVWAGTDLHKQAFIDALSIVALGSRIGSWPVQLLATRNHELCRRVALLMDTDKELDQSPAAPAWLADHDRSVVGVFHSHPTLEPSVTDGNERLVSEALDALNIDLAEPVSVASIHAAFRGARAAKGDRPATSAGSGARRKGEFSLALAEGVLVARESGASVKVPDHLRSLFDFVSQGLASEPPDGPLREENIGAVSGTQSSDSPDLSSSFTRGGQSDL